MSARPQHQHFDAVRATADRLEADAARLAFIDAFVAFEIAVNKWMCRAAIARASTRISVGQRIELLDNTDLAPFASKPQRARLTAILNSVRRLLDLRNAIVHGRSGTVCMDGEVTLLLQNSADCADGVQHFFGVTIAQLRQHNCDLVRFANEMTNWLNPPSPPRPTPGVAADP